VGWSSSDTGRALAFGGLRGQPGHPQDTFFYAAILITFSRTPRGDERSWQLGPHGGLFFRRFGDFVLTVPEPGPSPLAAVGGLALVGHRACRRRRGA
jgi:hypothetical protein